MLTDYNLIMFPNQNALGVQEIEVFVGFSAAQAQNILRRPTNLNRYIDMAIYIYIYGCDMSNQVVCDLHANLGRASSAGVASAEKLLSSTNLTHLTFHILIKTTSGAYKLGR